MPSVPIIDLGERSDPTPDEERRIARDLGDAARHLGFFYLQGHGIAPGLIEDAFAVSREFFALPAASKQALSITRSLENRGYVGLGVEALDPADRPDAKEAFNIGVGRLPDGSDGNVWPDVPRFEATMRRYRAAIGALAARVHRLFALDLGLDAGFFSGLFDNPMAILRLLHYPVVPEDQRARPGAGAHTDYGLITLLAQDSVGGLEVRRRDGQWVAAPPLPGAYVCNIGDCLMRWSNDIYVSNPHRVRSPGTHERYSIAYFSDPDPATEIRCLPGCASAARPERYAPIGAAEYMRQRFEATYAYRAAAR